MHAPGFRHTRAPNRRLILKCHARACEHFVSPRARARTKWCQHTRARARSPQTQGSHARGSPPYDTRTRANKIVATVARAQTILYRQARACGQQCGDASAGPKVCRHARGREQNRGTSRARAQLLGHHARVCRHAIVATRARAAKLRTNQKPPTQTGRGRRQRPRAQSSSRSSTRSRSNAAAQPAGAAEVGAGTASDDAGGDDAAAAEDDDNADDFFRIVGVWERTGSRSRRTLMETIEVRFHDWEHAKHPETLLAACIERLLHRVLAGRPAPLRVGLSLQPPGWDNCFHIPMRAPEQNSASALAAAIEAFAKQYDALDLFSADVRFKVAAVWPLPGANVGGACAANEQQARGALRCRSFVPVINGAAGDRWCLARAIVIGLADRQLCTLEQRPVLQFRHFCTGQVGAAGAPAAFQLLQAAGVSHDLPTYGVPEAKRIQHWLDATLGAQQVRLVIFARESGFRVAWKGELPARFNLCVVAQNSHYGYIQRPEQLFHVSLSARFAHMHAHVQARQYCVDCEQMVDRRTHPQGCRALCSQCLRFGWGRPCARVPGEGAPLRCDDCQFVFENRDCFEAHRRQVDPPPPGWQQDRRRGQRPHRSMCAERRVCHRCAQVVWVRHGAHQCGVFGNAVQQHQQQQQFCRRCQAMHDVQWTPHFIQPTIAVQQFGVVAGAPAIAEAMEQVEMLGGAEEADAALVGTEDDDDARQQQQQQPGRRRRRRRHPLRFLFWDVECAQERVEDPAEDDEAAAEHQLAVLKHVPVLVCAEVICERCIALGVDLEREPLRKAPNCCCGAAWRGAPRRQWAQRLHEDAFSDPDDDDAAAAAAHAGRGARERGDETTTNPRRLRFFNTNNNNTNNNNNNAAAGPSAMEQFVDFLLHTGPVDVCTVMLAHNGGRYDVHLLLEELQRQGVRPTRMVATGLRVYTLELGGRYQRHIIAKDTLNFFGCALAKLPATFGLRGVADKPYFPYKYIHEANMDVPLVGRLPPRDDYDPERMRPAERAQFMRWYDAEQQRRQGRSFVLRRELLRYCANDVRILRRAVLRFREVVSELADGMEPFMVAATIAGLALSIYRQCFLPPNVMVHTPEGGFLRRRLASAASRHFFALLEHQRPTWRGRLRTAQWSIGEECVEDDGYRLDAVLYRRVPLRPLAIEYNGCFFHGCPRCYPQRQQRLAGGQPAELLYVRTQQRAWALEHQHGYELKTVWECEFRQLLQRRPNLRLAYTDVCRAVPGPLDLRNDALFGGRTEPFALHYACADNNANTHVGAEEEEIDYLDIVSLYPFVMKYRPFPTGVPNVLTDAQLDARQPPLPWTRPADNPFCGFLLCRVLPPTPAELGARHTLLPFRTRGGRLTFPLCAMCAELGNADGRAKQHPQRQFPRALPRCRHGEQQRAWTHAYTHVELNAALALGYRVLTLYEVWHYEAWASLESGNSLFATYVDTLLRLKVEASGWPSDCTTAEQRARFVADYAQREGIHIDAQQVQPNPGMRAVVKTLLNALWGKLAQRAERDDIRYTGSAREFHDLLLDPRQDVVDFVHINEQLDRCAVRLRHPFVRGPATNNLAVACFVTAHARVYLHARLEEVRLAGGRPLYCDTDSVLFIKRRGAAPLPTEGDALGQLKRELPGRRIVQFFSAGPKNYGFRHVCARTGGDERAERKVRGLELNYVASQLLPFDRMCRMVLNYFGRRRNVERCVAVPQRRFVRTKRAEILTRPSTKLYRPVFTKGLVVAVAPALFDGGGRRDTAFFTRPFGWYDDDDDNNNNNNNNADDAPPEQQQPQAAEDAAEEEEEEEPDVAADDPDANSEDSGDDEWHLL
uniref:DNA-directed DNA polymerase n=1 Tax=Globodera pallida TaxID=36090 RepID=A0A183BN37_GLOPA